MDKKRILMCTEFSELPTGYSVYSKQVLSRLNQYPEFQIAELACYASVNDARISNVPWKVYANKPISGTPEHEEYKKSPISEFGEYSYNSVLLNFKPDFVFDIRDFWMMAFESNSPFRRFYNWAIMPTVDAEPQNVEWVDTYAQADAVFTYSEFGRDTLKKQSNDINFINIASPCASDVFTPVKDKNAHRASFSIDPSLYIVGTVMRNQRRKMYPDLFKGFREFLNKTKRNDVFLYCHTSYPDIGWDIPSLIMEYGLSGKVLFTYKCKKCNKLSADFFSDALKFCNNCKCFGNMIAGLNNAISEEELAQVYNLFDIYVQYANSEGFGMPQLEAAQCGNVVCSVNYSAMESVMKNIDGYPIKISEFYVEAETGCKRAIPDTDDFINLLEFLTSLSKEALKQKGLRIHQNTKNSYNWDSTAKKWADYFLNTATKDIRETWLSPPKIIAPAVFNDKISSPIEQADYLINHVLCKPEWRGKQVWRRLVKDLTYKSTVDNLGNFYFNESHASDALKSKPFTFEDAYNSMKAMRDYYNIWETHRQGHLK